jgi:hypothetical protein
MVSSTISFLLFFVRIETNEKTEEIISNIAMTEVNSSIKLVSLASDRCSAVIINRQNPSKFADVLKMCCDVLLAIYLIYYILKSFVIDNLTCRQNIFSFIF